MLTVALTLALQSTALACDCDVGCITQVAVVPTMPRNSRIFVLSNEHGRVTFTHETSTPVDVAFERAFEEGDALGTFYDLAPLSPGSTYEMSNAGCDLPPTTFQVSTREDTDPPTWSGEGEVEYACWRFQGRGCGGAELIRVSLDEATDDSGAVLYEVVIESPLETSTVFMTSAVGDLGITQCGANLDHDLTAGATARVRAVDLSGNATDFVEFTPKGQCRTSCGCQTGAVDLSGLWAGAAGVLFARRRRAARGGD